MHSHFISIIIISLLNIKSIVLYFHLINQVICCFSNIILIILSFILAYLTYYFKMDFINQFLMEIISFNILYT